MVIRIVFITPCSRPENLPALYESIRNQQFYLWLICYDAESFTPMFTHDIRVIEMCIPSACWGYQQRNTCLDYLKAKRVEAWVAFLDDDTLLNAQYVSRMQEIISGLPGHKIGVIVSQQVTREVIRHIDPEKVKEGHIDMAQYCLHTSLIADRRFIERRCADGAFIEGLYFDRRKQFVIVNEVLTYYNRLKWPVV